MPQTVKKSVHSFTHPDHVEGVQEDPIPYVPDNVSAALVPTQEETFDLTTPFDPKQFAERLKKVQMWTSYTGPVPESLDDYQNLQVELVGMVIQDLRDTNEDTGRTTFWQDIRFKTSEGKIISGGGKGIKQFAELLNSQLGQGDWPTAIKVMVRRRKLNGVTKDGQPKYMPTFEVLA